MTVRGTLNADTIKVARITVDMLQQTPSIDVLAALVNEKTGQTLAWANSDGARWSPATLEKLRELREAMEEDMGKALFIDHVVERRRASGGRGVRMEGGLGEHLSDGTEAPSI